MSESVKRPVIYRDEKTGKSSFFFWPVEIITEFFGVPLREALEKILVITKKVRKNRGGK